MDNPITWAIPPPPPDYVLSVRDADGHEWRRVRGDDELWTKGIGEPASWDWLVYYHGPITAEELAR